MAIVRVSQFMVNVMAFWGEASLAFESDQQNRVGLAREILSLESRETMAQVAPLEDGVSGNQFYPTLSVCCAFGLCLLNTYNASFKSAYNSHNFPIKIVL